MAILSGDRDGEENVRRQEVTVDDEKSVVGYLGPELTRVIPLVVVRTEVCGDDEMRTQRHQRDQPREWVAAERFLSPSLAPEVFAILLRVRDANRRAVDTVQRESAPGVASRALVSPLR